MKYRHYAPNASVSVLVGSETDIMDFLSDKKNFGIICYDEDKRLLSFDNSFSLGSASDPASQASRLFDILRYFDSIDSVKNIYARMPEKNGVGLAVYNRLLKAAGFTVVTLSK